VARFLIGETHCCIDHVASSVSAIYDRHHYDVEARGWLQKWADYLEALTVRNVVPLRAARQLLLAQFGLDCLEQIVVEVKEHGLGLVAVHHHHRLLARHAQRLRGVVLELADVDGLRAVPSYATAQSADRTSACSSTVCVAFSCLSGG